MATIRENEDFEPGNAAEAMHEALKGIGTDEDEVIRQLTTHVYDQRHRIQQAYKIKYGDDLVDDLKSNLRGDLEKVVEALMVEPALYDAKELRKAMRGAGTDDSVLIEIMCSRTNDQIEAIKGAYNSEFDRDLEEDLKEECKFQFRRLMVGQCNAEREEGEVDLDSARDDAQTIFDAGADQWGTDEAAIQEILCLRSYVQLNAIFIVYNEIAEQDIEDSIRAECAGDVQDGFLAIIKFARGPAKFFAERLHHAMQGGGTDEDALIRIIVARSEIDMRRVNRQFHEMYDDSLHDYLDSNVRGDFRKILMAVAGAEEDD